MKKRLAAVFTALSMVISFAAANADSPNIAAETKPMAASATEAWFDGSIAGGSYSVTLTADNFGDRCDAAVAIAVYDTEPDRLMSVKRSDVTIPANKAAFTANFVGSCPETGYIKAFLWDSTEGLRPLAAAREIRPSADFALKLNTGNVWANDRQDEHSVAELLDGDSKTYLAGEAKSGSPVSINVILEQTYKLTEIALGFDPASNPARSYSFDVEGSVDGETYFSVLERQSSDTSANAPLGYAIDAEAKYVRVNVYGYNGKESGWVRITELGLRASGVGESRRVLMHEDLTGASVETVNSDLSWFAYALDEEKYTDYTPSTGTELFAEIAPMPDSGEAALRIVDGADRSGSSVRGAGAVGAFRRLAVPSDGSDYTVSFKMLLAEDSPNIYWSGISLLCRPVTGGADLYAAAAMQLRFEADGGKARVSMLRSVQFNEGNSLLPCFGSGFALGVPWEVKLEVSPKGKRVRVSIDDGTVRGTKTLGYNCTDDERTNNKPWNSDSVQYLSVNSGAGGKAEIYVSDLEVSCDENSIEPEEKTVFEQNFENTDDLSAAGIAQTVVKASENGSSSALSGSLGAKISQSGTFSSKVMLLTDKDTANGLLVGVPLTVPDNGSNYIIKWRMREFAPKNYSGFSLGSGQCTGFGDGENPLALQLRYSMQNGSVQLNRYNSVLLNDGSFDYFMAGSGSYLGANREWRVSIEVNPNGKRLNISINDGVRTVNASAPFAMQSKDASVTEEWDGKQIDTLFFHTAAGGTADCIIDDIQVIDTGRADPGSVSAEGGIVRLEGKWGAGKFLTQDGEKNPGLISDVDPNRTRFIERGGLIDSRGVSFESLIMPGYYLVAEETNDVNHTYTLALKPLENTAQFMAHATFGKHTALNSGSYTGTTVKYSPIFDSARTICYTNTSSDPLTLISLKSSDYTHSNLFYLRSEATSYVCDNFKGSKLNSQWHTNYPWKKNNPTNDCYNFSALIDYRNISVSDGELLLKATKASGWPTDLNGDTGHSYNGSYGKNWVAYAGRVGVVSIADKVYNRQSLIEGSFKQPSSPVGYWNAFWLAGRDSWPPEIDIFEFLSSTYGHKAWHTALHGEGDKNNLFGKQTSQTNLTDGFHTFTLDWGYNYVKFYLDGKQFAKGANNNTITFQKNMRLILNTGIGGWEAEPDNTMLWDDGLRSRWVRSFQYN